MRIKPMRGFFRYSCVLLCCSLVLGCLLAGFVYNASGTDSLADLTGAWSKFSWSPDGLTVKGTLLTSNIGTADAGSFTISFFLSDDGATLSQLLYQVSVSKLPAGHFKQISFKYESSSPLFGKSIIAFINSGNSASESDYANDKVPVLISSTDIPFANAGPGRTISAGQTVYLDGSKSTDPDGRPLTYNWSFSSVPAGSLAVISQPHSALPTFTADLAGTYTIELTVNNGVYDSAPATVTITTGNTPPVANAGADQAAQVASRRPSTAANQAM